MPTKKPIKKRTDPIMTAIDSTSIIKAFHKKKDHTYTIRQLCKELHAKEYTSQKNIKQIVSDLVYAKKLDKIDKERYLLSSASTYVVGTVDYVRAEYVYIVLPGDEKDVIVKKHNLGVALDKDLVKVRLLPNKGRKSRQEGKVVEIIERSKVPIIGRLIKQDGVLSVSVDQRRLSYQVLVKESELNGAQENDKVVVQLSNDVKSGNALKGRITKVLGQTGIHEVEMHAIMTEFGLEAHFPEQVMLAAKATPTAITKEEVAKRRDLRKYLTFTIDPADAKDFDDAISYQQLSNGNYEVGIHIADVSHYVTPGSTIDEEAYNRNTSVYLVDRTIPMLPENLSNQLCSLNPYEDKLTFSAVFELNPKGVIKREWFGETVIHSGKRFTYEEAQQIITSSEGDFALPLTQLNNLAKQLRAARCQAGAINFETKEVKFRLDESGKPLEVITKVREDAHKLVEEFMLLANKCVASHVAQLNKKINKKKAQL